MNSEEKDSNKNEADDVSNTIQPTAEEQSKIDAINALQEDIIRNDTIPETSRTTPGSNGAFPVGAFDTSKD
jgi:hypothetical protein